MISVISKEHFHIFLTKKRLMLSFLLLILIRQDIVQVIGVCQWNTDCCSAGIVAVDFGITRRLE